MKNIYKELNDAYTRLDLTKNLRIEVMLKIADSINLVNKNILDIGCYDGTFLSLIKNRNNKFYGIEANDYGVVECKKKEIKVEQLFFDDKSKFPFEKNFFDFIVAGEIIEHIYDTDFFLEEIHRILKPGGKLIISTPNIASLGRRLFLFIGRNPIIEVSPNEANSSGHIRYFTFDTFEWLLKKHNFKLLKKQSDVVNFSSTGNLKSKMLAKILPQIGQSIIALYEK